MEPGLATPILPARDLAETRAFYERLGFVAAGWWPNEFGGYAILTRGDLGMHFFSFTDLSPLENYAQCYWRVNDVDTLHAECVGAGLPTRYGLAGIALLLASSLGLLLAGIFPWIMVNGVPTETKPHVVGAILSFVGASTGLIALSRRMRADTRWQNLATYVLVTGVTMLMLFVVLGALAIDEGAPLHPWAGLLQRVVVLIWFACIIAIAWNALRVRTTVSIQEVV